MEKKKFSLVIPTFNEAENIRILISRLQQVLQKYEYEIIIVDDDSPDQTWKIVQDYGKHDNRIKCLRRFNKKGLSRAVIDGFGMSTGEFLGVMDADLQHDEKLLPKMLELLEKNTIVIGSRKVYEGGSDNWNYFRRFISWGAILLSRLVVSNKVKDIMSGYFVLRREVFKKVEDQLTGRGFKILLEILTLTEENKIREVGYVIKSRRFGESKLSGKIVLEFLVSLAQFKWRNLDSRMVKFFIVGASGIIVNLGFLAIFKEYLSLSINLSILLAIEVSIISNFILNNFWTFQDCSFFNLKENLKGFPKFQLFCFLGMIINFLVTKFLSFSGLNLYLSQFIGIVVASFINYKLNYKWTWKVSEHA